MTAPQTQILETRGAAVAYDVRPGSSASEPPLLLIGSVLGPNLARRVTEARRRSSAHHPEEGQKS